MFTTLQIICTSFSRTLVMYSMMLKKYKLFYLLNGTGHTKHDTKTHLYSTKFLALSNITGKICLMFTPNFPFFQWISKVRLFIISNMIFFAFTTRIIMIGYLQLVCEIKTGGFSIEAILMTQINTQFNKNIFILNCVTT